MMLSKQLESIRLKKIKYDVENKIKSVTKSKYEKNFRN